MRKTVSRGMGPLGVFFITFLLLVLLAGGVLYFSVLHPGPAQKNTVYTFSDAGGKTVSSVSARGEDAYAGNVQMFPFQTAAEFLDLKVSGNRTARTYYLSESESIVFTVGSRTAKVGGRDFELTAAPYFAGDELWVPLDFVSGYIKGITLSVESGRVQVRRDVYNASTEDSPLYLDVTASLHEDTPLAAQTDEAGAQAVDNADWEGEYLTDISDYLAYIEPADADAYLILVNRTSTVDRSYLPSPLVNVADSRSDRTERMQETAEKALEALYIEMRAAGYKDVSVTSGYRSYDKQEYLYNLYTEKEMQAGISRAEAEKIVDTYSARPGTSEHQTGLCCDMHNLPSADQRFAQKEAYKWLVENAHKFGFILRFPEGKEDLTGYEFEPWHYRFVGRKHATEIYRQGLCLEEYLEKIK
ncbi:MAG: D-alanyl-D-alanine carboxypeptidase family protein [Clostridia bacterium]|nr:D-alanyl-D-alanine carboxypeptidase family protein [Clostridia bacterium]